MPLRPILLPRLVGRMPLRRLVQGVTTMSPEQYDTAHDLNDLFLFLLSAT